MALAAALAACGDDAGQQPAASQGAAESYPVRIVTASFPRNQRLGETSLLRIGVRNAGEEAIPALTITVSVGGRRGQNSKLPFGIRDPQPGLAQPDRPIWVLEEGYPRPPGSAEPGGSTTASEKTFEFGRLPAGDELQAVWKVTAVRTGTYRVLYEVGAGGLRGGARAEAPGGRTAGGALAARITEVPPETVVTDDGEVRPAPRDPTEANR